MTENFESDVISSEVLPENHVAEPESSIQPEISSAPEKKYTDEEVSRIVARKKREAYEKGKREAMSELKAQETHVPEIQAQAQPSAEEQKRLIEETVRQMADAEIVGRCAQDFVGKLSSGKEKYADFDEKVAELQVNKLPLEVWMGVNSAENPVEIMYELANNPGKLGELMNLTYNPKLLKTAINQFSSSIKQNETAKNARKPSQPLSHLKPSTLNADSGPMSMSDLRRKYSNNHR